MFLLYFENPKPNLCEADKQCIFYFILRNCLFLKKKKKKLSYNVNLSYFNPSQHLKVQFRPPKYIIQYTLESYYLVLFQLSSTKWQHSYQPNEVLNHREYLYNCRILETFSNVLWNRKLYYIEVNFCSSALDQLSFRKKNESTHTAFFCSNWPVIHRRHKKFEDSGNSPTLLKMSTHTDLSFLIYKTNGKITINDYLMRSLYLAFDFNIFVRLCTQVK